MKLSKTAWLILGIGVFIIVFVTLLVVFLQQGREQQRLDSNLALAQTTLPGLVSQREGMESQLTQAKSELAQADSWLDEATAKFQPVESIEYDEALFDFADDYKLEITELTASEPRDQEVELEPNNDESPVVTYATVRFKVTVEGTVAQILGFINTIATDEDFVNATIESVKMENLEPSGEEEPKAIIDLTIYGYEGE